MIWNFICNKTTCLNKDQVIRLVNPINPVLCSSCHTFSNATETQEPAPELATEE